MAPEKRMSRPGDKAFANMNAITALARTSLAEGSLGRNSLNSSNTFPCRQQSTASAAPERQISTWSVASERQSSAAANTSVAQPRQLSTSSVDPVPVSEDIRRPASEGRPRGPMRRLYTLNRDSLKYDDSLGLAPDGSPLASRTLSVCSAPSPRSRISKQLPIIRAATSTSGVGVERSSPRYGSLEVSPAWSLRYCELIGSVINPDDQLEREKVTDSGRWKRMSIKKECAPLDNPADSVFLAKNGRDKRLPDPEWLPHGETKTSRYQARRSAITGFGQSKLQARVAVKIHAARHPSRMREIQKGSEAMAGSGKIQVNVRSLDTALLDAIMTKTGLGEEEILNLYDAFTRYDIDDSGTLDRVEARQVLCDLGLQPRGREEKLEVYEIMCDADAEGLRHHSFEEFVIMVKAVRERLRQMQSAECMTLYEDVDKARDAFLSMEQVFSILDRRLHMAPRSEREKDELTNMFYYCDRDHDNQLNFEEFQEFVQRARAKLMMMRREEEITIAKAFLLPPDVVAEFRMDLPQLWIIFNRYDRKGYSTVNDSDLYGLLIDVGTCPCRPQPGCAKMVAMERAVRDLAEENTEFPLFLRLIHELRLKGKESMMDELRERFHFYDKDRSGELSFSEVYQILGDFKMLPKSREEQTDIVDVIERLDADGSGTFDFQEFQEFVQRLTEQVQTAEREAERHRVLAMGFTEAQLQALRSVFFGLQPSPCGKVAQIGLVSAVNRTRDILCPPLYGQSTVDEVSVREITRNAQQQPARGITFQEFAQSLKLIMAKKDDDQNGDDM